MDSTALLAGKMENEKLTENKEQRTENILAFLAVLFSCL
jgi:hypothetical protein